MSWLCLQSQHLSLGPQEKKSFNKNDDVETTTVRVTLIGNQLDSKIAPSSLNYYEFCVVKFLRFPAL